MSLDKEYFFSDFTLSNYSRLLELIKLNYSFTDFKNFKDSKIVILRHDIEFSIPIAKRMAEIEQKLGICSTYFLQLHSEYYNPLDKDSYNSIRSILEMGHQLGLHFDFHFWNIEEEVQLEEHLIIDKEMLEKYFNVKLRVFSFHNTNKFILTIEKKEYAGMINVYSSYFKEKFGYCTDSTGFWRYERLENRLKEAKDNKLQILIHDGMWQDEILPPRRRIYKVIDDRATYLKNFYDATLKKFGAKNIDWDEVY